MAHLFEVIQRWTLCASPETILRLLGLSAKRGLAVASLQEAGRSETASAVVPALRP